MNKNIIPIENPDKYVCKLDFYTRSHASLNFGIIPVSSDLELRTFKIEFSLVVYFSGATAWKNANWYVAPPDECLSILRQMATLDKFTDEYLTDEYKLFTSGTSRLEVRVVAGNLIFEKITVNGKILRLDE